MKHIILSIITLTFIGGLALAQEFEQPKEGAKIFTEANTIEMNGNTASFDLWIVRSKKASKAKFATPKLSLNKDQFAYEVIPNPENNDHFTVNVTNKSASKDNHSFTIYSKGYSYHKITGKTMTISVMNTGLISKEGE